MVIKTYIMEESRAQFHSRLCCIKGQSSLDRERNIPILLQMARSDVSILKEFMSETILAIENILKYKNVKGLKSLVMELNSLGTIGLEAIDKHIESILNLTKKERFSAMD